MTEWSWEGTDYNTISLTLITGNATFPSSNNTTNHLAGGEVAAPSPWPPSEDDQSLEHLTTALIAIVAGVISFLTIVGNIMVMVSFKIDKQLQTISNYFLLSLAVADLIIGAFSVPLFTVMLIMEKWPFSSHLCDAWLAIDYLASNASVWNLMMISIDRYFSVTRPLSYRAQRTTMKALLMILFAWGLSCVMWVIPIYAWQYIEGERKEEECYVQFVESNKIMSILCAVLAFFLPVTIMVCLYVRVWWETVKRQRDLVHLQAGKKISKRSTSSNEEDHIYSNRLSVGTLHGPDMRDDGLLQVCLHYCIHYCCCGRSRSRLEGQERSGVGHVTSNGALPITSESGETLTMTSSRSYNTLCSDNRRQDGNKSKWNTNGYRATSRSTDDIMEDMKHCNGDSVYTILIQFPANSLPDNADTTSITMLSDTDTTEPERQTARQNRCVSNSRAMSSVSRSSSGHSVLAGSTSTTTATVRDGAGQLKMRSYSCIPDTLDLNARIVPKSYVKTVSHQNTKSSAVPSSSLPRKNKIKKATQEKRQERKAAKTLSAILLVFILTWTPYNVLAVMKGILGPDQSDIIPEIIWNIAYCLCYINSTINPFCYALCNAAFRRTYIRILTFKWRSSQKQPVNTYYYG